MSALADWLPGALFGSSLLMLVVLALRRPARRWIGPRIGYALWALPALRMIAPPLPADLLAAVPMTATTGLTVLATGPLGASLAADPATAWGQGATLLAAIWLAGAVALLGWHVARHARFRRRLLASATPLGDRDGVRIVAATVEGPLAFGVIHRFIAVPRDFASRYGVREQQLALAHEGAHHARGDLAANWASLVMLAVHWWNPVAWAAISAFREDQEFAVDALVLARSGPDARLDYARVLARAAGVDALPACHLNTRSNLKGRLIMLAQQPLSNRRKTLGGTALAVLGATALAATLSATSVAAPSGSRQAVTIGIKPDGAGSYAVIVGGASVTAGNPLPGGATLPADFDPAGGCNLKPSAKPRAMLIKGSGGTTTYSVMCASAKPASIRATLAEGLTSLKTMRGSIATQPASAAFPETERTHALGAVDRSIREVQGAIAKAS